MRIAILTSTRRGSASRCLPLLAEDPGIEVVLVILNDGSAASGWDRLKRILRKIRRIGILGACIGLYIRRWYRGSVAEDILDVASRYGIRVETTPAINHDRTRHLLKGSAAELGISLGNGYIPMSVFEIPLRGMINFHGEVLPRFQGAISIIWAIHEGISETGFTIHKIDKTIDTGAILYQERFPIHFYASLGKTVRGNVAEINRHLPLALAAVVDEYEKYSELAVPQSGGRRYTTPTGLQFMKMLSQHRRLLQRFSADLSQQAQMNSLPRTCTGPEKTADDLSPTEQVEDRQSN